jgi:hypothetical protein
VFELFDDDDLAEDYRMLLREGYVKRALISTEHDAWRRELRRKARADRLRIRTFSGSDAVCAALDVGPDNVVHLGEPGEWWRSAE